MAAGCCLPSSLVPRVLETQAAPRFLSFFLLCVPAVSLPRPSPQGASSLLLLPRPLSALLCSSCLLPAGTASSCRQSLRLLPLGVGLRIAPMTFFCSLLPEPPRWSSPGPGPQLCCSLFAGPAALLFLLPLGCCLAAFTTQCSQTLPHTATSQPWSPSPAWRALGRGRRGCQDWSLIPTPWCACTPVMLSP